MTRLTRVELRRLLARRLVVLAMLAGVLVVLASVAGAWSDAQPVPEPERRAAEQAYQDAAQDWAENGEEYVRDCERAQVQEEEASGEPVDFACGEMEPRLEHFLQAPGTFADRHDALVGGLLYPLILLALLVGGTAVAAEFSTGAIGNWLTFEPRRGRVLASKVVAVALVMAPVTLLLVTIVALGAWLAYGTAGRTGTMTDDDVRGLVETCLRIAALGAGVAVVGAALGFLLRSTAAVLGAALVFLVVAEGMLVGRLPALQGWSVTKNVEAWAFAGTTYEVYGCESGPRGAVCEGVTHELGAGRGGAYLLILTVALVGLAAVDFRRRDIG